MLKRSVKPAGAAALALLFLSGCAGQMPAWNSFNSNDPGQRAIGGAVVGAGTGALTGGLIGGWEGAGVGAAAGAVIGAVAGAATTPGGGSQAAAYSEPAPVYQPQTSAYPATSSYSGSYTTSAYAAPVVQR